jgi:hypothetical protein
MNKINDNIVDDIQVKIRENGKKEVSKGEGNRKERRIL